MRGDLEKMKINYIENNIEYGIDYDWKTILKEYKKIVPSEYHFITKIPFGKVGTVIELSERSIGKTTNFLILGMIMNQKYNTIIQYVRSKDDSIRPMALQDLFSTILKYHYVEKITNNKYNSVEYNRRRWYFCNRDETGKITDICDKHFMFCCSVNKAIELKSSYNSPTGDLIIFDEFIGKYYPIDEFLNFLDLTKTIIRERLSATIILLANTIDKESQYFDELECRDLILEMECGDRQIYETSLGSVNYIEYLENTSITKKEKKEIHNKKYYGYSNNRLNAITGHGWSITNYPHIIKRNKTIIYRYIEHSKRKVRLELQNDENLGLYVNVIPCKHIYENEIVFTLSDIPNKNYRYRFGYSKTDKIIWNLYKQNKFYYATNGIGAFIKNYINQAMQLK